MSIGAVKSTQNYFTRDETNIQRKKIDETSVQRQKNDAVNVQRQRNDKLMELRKSQEQQRQRRVENQQRNENLLSKKSNEVTMSTDKVDREIKTLQSKGLQLAKSINASDDEEIRLNLEEQLAQVQDELRRKNNDSYRRQNAEISLGVDVYA